MPYDIYKSDGTQVTVNDNTIDTTYYNPNANGTGKGVGSQLVGRNAIDYGKPIAQNFLQLTENFCGPNMPTNAVALQGQLWFKKTSASIGTLYVKTNTTVTGSTPETNGWAQVLTSAPGAINSLLPTQAGNAGKYLTTDGIDVSWANPSAYTLPPASGSVLGGIKVGTGLSITLDGTLSATGTAGVSQIVAGSGVNISPTTGLGVVTISATGGTGTVTNVSGTGNVNGITLSGSVSSSGNLTLGGTLTGVSLTSQVSGTLPITNGGTGATTATQALTALLPSQTGNSGAILTTNGVSPSWLQMTNSATSNGYTTLPGNVRYAWGSVNFGDIYAGHDTETISFGGIFSQVFNVQVQLQRNTADPDVGAAYPIITNNLTNSEFSVFLRETNSGVGPYTIFWFAVGLAA